MDLIHKGGGGALWEEFGVVHKGLGMPCVPGIKDKDKIAFVSLMSSVVFLYYFVQEQ